MDKLRLKFTKTGRAVYISHLDLMRTLQRVFFRAGLPLRYSEGFNPHARISIILPLSVGTSSRCEYLDFWLTEDVPLDMIPARLNAAMPEGIEALSVWAAETKGAQLKWIELQGRFTGCRDAAFYEVFYAKPSLPVVRKSKRGEREEDIAPWIKSATFSDGDGCVNVRVILSAQEPTVSPELFVSALGEDAPEYYRFERVKAYLEEMTEFF